MHRALAILLFAAPLAFAAPVPKELKRGDETRILGTWDMVAHSMAGGPPTPQTVKWRLESGGQALILNPNEIAIGYRIHGGTPPKGFDWNWPGSSHLGLYELDENTLKVVITIAGGSARPTELKPGSDVIYCEFKRIPMGDKK